MEPIYKIVTTGPDGFDVQTIQSPDPLAAFEIRGFTLSGFTRTDGPLRAELKGQPRFHTLAGPMWDGHDDEGRPVIRYESSEANDQLSA